jgi:uncharacterized membrane protein
MHRFLEIILGLERGFLSRQGDFELGFNPRWPYPGAFTWNFILCAVAIAIVIYVYRREGRSRLARITLGTARLVLLAFIIALLNRPVLTLVQSRTDPSVLAIMLDDSASMKIRDAGIAADGQPVQRFQAMLELLNGQEQKLMRELAKNHSVRFYRFSSDAQPMARFAPGPATQPAGAGPPPELPAAAMLGQLQPEGKSTQVLSSLRGVLQDLQGQRIAGVVMLTDGRSSPQEAAAEQLAAIEKFGVRIYPVSIGSDQAPQNLVVEDVAMEEAAFARDIVGAKVTVRGSGYPQGHIATVVLKNRATGLPLLRSDGQPAEETIILSGDLPQEVELTFKPQEPGPLTVLAEVIRQPGEIDEEDNVFPRHIDILDARISVLYCDGYPRWEYRYLKNSLMRDDTVEVSLLLFSADFGFAQEGNKPINRFPESMTEMLNYDVVIFGDVDPRQFTDAQLQLVADFVLRKHGGFGMIAGPRYAPHAYRNTPVEAVLPISISRNQPDAAPSLSVGWRPVLTRAGENSMIFRFFEDRKQNEKYIKEELQPLFWFARGITAKRDIGEVYAEHPHEIGPDGRKAPLLVLGRYGGRTLFSGIDDTWRWRFYTGESIFDTYWIQQLRYLAREKKLGQRRFTLMPMRPSYELGQQVEVQLRILDPDLLQQLPDQISVLVTQGGPDGADQQAVRQQLLERRPGQNDLYTAGWTADRVGRFALKLPALAGSVEAAEVPIVVKEPRLELANPQVDRDLLTKLLAKDADAGGPDVSKLFINAQNNPDNVRTELAKIASAAMIVPIYTDQLLWNAPLVMLIFVLLITAEWVLRKVYGML